jgi:hypothetical protein
MRRRQFIAGLVVAATMGRAQAQQTPRAYRIAVVDPAASIADLTETGAFRRYVPSSSSYAGSATPKDRTFWSSDIPARGGPSILPNWPAMWFAVTQS